MKDEPFVSNDLQRLHEWLFSAVSKGPVAVITGKNGDMDTVGSAVALAASHPHMMACGLHLGRLAKQLVEEHRAPFRKLAEGYTAWPAGLASAVIVDAASPEQVGLPIPAVPLCIIDHHATDGWSL